MITDRMNQLCELLDIPKRVINKDGELCYLEDIVKTDEGLSVIYRAPCNIRSVNIKARFVYE